MTGRGQETPAGAHCGPGRLSLTCTTQAIFANLWGEGFYSAPAFATLIS
jgi:hypothetical protein